VQELKKLLDLSDIQLAERLSSIEIEIDALETMEMKMLSDIQLGRNPGPISSVVKLRGSELHQEITRLGVDVLGLRALVWEPRRPLYALNEAPILPEAELPVVPAHLNSRALTILAGSSEIQHEIIAKQILGL
jgi:acyl-CoA dehydrogenase